MPPFCPRPFGEAEEADAACFDDVLLEFHVVKPEGVWTVKIADEELIPEGTPYTPDWWWHIIFYCETVVTAVSESLDDEN